VARGASHLPPEQWIYWDMAFLLWGAAMLVAGWVLLKTGQGRTGGAPDVQGNAG
jgi:uncharacterized membrane protein